MQTCSAPLRVAERKSFSIRQRVSRHYSLYYICIHHQQKIFSTKKYHWNLPYISLLRNTVTRLWLSLDIYCTDYMWQNQTQRRKLLLSRLGRRCFGYIEGTYHGRLCWNISEHTEIEFKLDKHHQPCQIVCQPLVSGHVAHLKGSWVYGLRTEVDYVMQQNILSKHSLSEKSRASMRFKRDNVMNFISEFYLLFDAR